MSFAGLVTLYTIVIVVLIVLSFYFSVADMAYGSVTLTRMERIANKGDKKDKTAAKLKRHYDTTISTILFYNDVCNAGIDIFATFLGVLIATQYDWSISASNAGLIFSLIALIFKVAFGDIIAKSIGKVYNYRLVRFYARVINALYYISIPVTYLVGGFGSLVTYPITHNVQDNVTNDEDLQEMVDEIEEEGTVDEEKAEMLRGAIDYATTELYEIMTPRAKIYAVDKTKTVSKILSDERAFTHSRIPVYEESIDNIIGYVRMRDLIALKIQKKEDITPIIENIPIFPRTEEINNILAYFNEHHSHIGVVLDEYGGTEGIVTKEDIVEEIVGEIWDETDDPEELLDEKTDGTFIVDGGMNLEDFCTEFDIDYDEIDTEYVTIGGFMIELLDDRFANVGDEVWLDGVKLRVIAIDKNRTVKKLQITPKPEEEEDDIPLLAVMGRPTEKINTKNESKKDSKSKKTK